jgi:hypothetical protein
VIFHVALVRNDVSEEHIASIIRVTRIGGLRTTLAVTAEFLRSVLRLVVTAKVVTTSLILVTLTMEAIRSFETSVLTGATWRDIQKDGILQSHRCENLRSYM